MQEFRYQVAVLWEVTGDNDGRTEVEVGLIVPPIHPLIHQFWIIFFQVTFIGLTWPAEGIEQAGTLWKKLRVVVSKTSWSFLLCILRVTTDTNVWLHRSHLMNGWLKCGPQVNREDIAGCKLVLRGNNYLWSSG